MLHCQLIKIYSSNYNKIFARTITYLIGARLLFITKHLIYLELQKTGGSHIRRLLEHYADGVAVGKHNRLQDNPDNKAVIGSIRNPWDWYVSLWAYGASGIGAIRSRTSHRLDFDYYYRMLPKSMGKNWISVSELITSIRHDIVKPVSRWQHTYTDAEDAALFRAWLKLLFDKKRRFDIGEGYGFSPLSQHAGLLTYRYFRLFTQGDGVFNDNRLAHPELIAHYDQQHTILTDIIKMESLEDDFIRILRDTGITLTDEQLHSLMNKDEGKTNASRRKSMAYYYDSETIDLVAHGDKYLIDRYGYQPPV